MRRHIHINVTPGSRREAARAVGAGVPLVRDIRRGLRAAVARALDAEGVSDAEISVTLVDDAAMSDLHGKYLDRPGPTDVMAFALHEAGEAPLGDIYIDLPQALRQAAEHDEAPEIELARLAIHGTLHVLGYDHPEGPDRTQSEMWVRQEAILGSLNRPAE